MFQKLLFIKNTEKQNAYSVQESNNQQIPSRYQ